MAWQLVGVTSGAGTSSGYTISLNGTLTGGIASSPAPGDLVVVMTAFGNTASSAPAVSGNNSGAYNAVAAAVHANDTWDTEAQPFWEVMGSTPDTSLTITRVTNAAYGGATAVEVWRGVDQGSPYIGAATQASGTNGCVINPPAYDPAISGALIFAAGAGTMADTSSDYTGFTGMSNFLTKKGDGSTADCAVLTSQHALAPAKSVHGHTAETPALSTVIFLGIGETAHGHVADSLVLDISDAQALDVAGASSSHLADTPALTANSVLAVIDALHAVTSSSLSLSSADTLGVVEAVHAHLSDSVTLGMAEVLAILEALHHHVAQEPVIQDGGVIPQAIAPNEAKNIRAMVSARLAGESMNIGWGLEKRLRGEGGSIISALKARGIL